MSTSVKFLFVFLVYTLMLPVSHAQAPQTKLLQQVNIFKSHGQLSQAYELLNKSNYHSIDTNLQLALLADMLGKEKQANGLFEALLANKKLPKKIRNNIKRFRLEFAVSLQKRLKQAQHLSQVGQCKQASLSYNYLWAFDATKKKAAAGLYYCQGNVKNNKRRKSNAFLGRLNYRVGQDSNVPAANEELLSDGESLLSDSYQKIQLNLGYKWRSHILSTAFTLNPSFDFLQKTYTSDEGSASNARTRKVQVNLLFKSRRNVMWRVAIGTKTLDLNGEEYVSYDEVAPSATLSHPLYGVSVRSRFKWRMKYRKYAAPIYQGRDGWGYTIDYRLSVPIIKRLSLKPGIWYRQQEAKVDKSRAYDALGIKLTAQYKYEQYSLSGSYQLTNYEYQAADSSHSSPKKNDRTDLRGSLRFQVSANWQAFLLVNYTQQLSNQALYEFERLKSELGFVFKF